MSWTHKLSCFPLLLALPTLCHAGNYLPSILWYPRNPLFSCSDPVVNVQLDDRLSFVCPHSKVITGQSSTFGEKYYENLFFLGNEKTRYDSCDASGLQSRFKFLSCDTPETISDRNTYELHFRATATSETTITFAEATSYYLIGTGFRDLDKLSRTVGGSCNNTRSAGEYKLRLRIRVCSQDELNTGACTVCKSDGCYYKECGVECSNWTMSGDVYRSATNECWQLMKRQCTNQLLGTKVDEQYFANASCAAVVECGNWTRNGTVYRSESNCYQFQERSCRNLIENLSYVEKFQEIAPCPAVVECGNWTLNGTVYRSESSCYQFRERSCRNLIENLSYVEKLQEIAPCPPVTESVRSAQSDDSNTYKYIAIGATIACFLLGLVVGAVCHRSHHQRACPSRARVRHDSMPIAVPYENHAYRRSQNEEDFVEGKTKLAYPVASMNGGIHLDSPSSNSTFVGQGTDANLPRYSAKLSTSS